MRSKIAKQLRREAAAEMSHDQVPERDLVMGKRSVVNSPQSVRAMYLALKKAYKKSRSSTATKQQFVVQSTNTTQGVLNV